MVPPTKILESNMHYKCTRPKKVSTRWQIASQFASTFLLITYTHEGEWHAYMLSEIECFSYLGQALLHRLCILCFPPSMISTALYVHAYHKHTPPLQTRGSDTFCMHTSAVVFLFSDVTTAFTLTAMAAVCGVGVVAAYLIVKQLFPRFARAALVGVELRAEGHSCLPLRSVTSPNSVFSKSLEAVQKDEKVRHAPAINRRVHPRAHSHSPGEERFWHADKRFWERFWRPPRGATVCLLSVGWGGSVSWSTYGQP